MKKIFSVIALSLSSMICAYGQTFNVADVQMGPNGQKQVAIVLNNPSKALTAFQFDLVVPEGVSIDVEGASLNPTRVSNHELIAAEIGNHTYRFLTFSKTNDDILGSQGELVYVPLITSGSVAGEVLTASVEQQLVCASDGSNKDLANVTFDVKVSGEQSFAFGASGLLTCVSKFDLDFTNLENVEAYIATGYDLEAKELWMTRVKDVPAGTPIWVSGPANETIAVPETPANTCYPANLLVGDATTSVKVPVGDEQYEGWVLEEDGQFAKVVNEMSVEAGKAYLRLPKTVVTEVASTGILPFTMPDNTNAYVGKYDLDFSNVDGLKAYTVTGFAKGGEVLLTPVKKASAGTPLYLVGEKGASFMVPSTMVQTAYANMLKGSAIYTTDISSLDSDLSFYTLSNNKFTYMSPRVLSIMGRFNAGVVYMAVPSEYAINPTTKSGYNTSVAEAEFMTVLLSSERTAINGLKASRKDEGVWYNLQGQRVENPRKGLYILDGKKKFVK